ncbi:MAG TPA: hypothetical protein VFL04_07505, partial [Rectinemataceae bacterium]|nr:hypothetical protein [Rectinemataceae bacterium]
MIQMSCIAGLVKSIELADREFGRMDEGLRALMRNADELVAVACGSTALGLAAAARDLPRLPLRVIADPSGDGLEPLPGARGSIVLGLSFSGASVEVGDLVGRAADAGIETVYAGPPAACPAKAHCLRLDLGGLPRRYLPLAACLLIHRVWGPGPDARLVDALRATASVGPSGLSGFLEAAFRSPRIPVFVSAGPGLRAALLAAQYLEFL